MVLTIQEVARRLKLPVETVRRWVLQGKIPMSLSRGEYIIRLEMLERWADEHQLKIDSPVPPAEMVREAPAFDGILPAMQRGGVFYGLEGDTKGQVLQSAAARIPNILPADRDLVCAKLIEREGLASTGIGHGIALPHPRANPDIELAMPQISTCFLARPVAFDAIDRRPVSVLMVLLSGSTQVHLTMMSKLSYFLRDGAFRAHLLSTPPPEVLLGMVAEAESNKR